MSGQEGSAQERAERNSGQRGMKEPGRTGRGPCRGERDSPAPHHLMPERRGRGQAMAAHSWRWRTAAEGGVCAYPGERKEAITTPRVKGRLANLVRPRAVWRWTKGTVPTEKTISKCPPCCEMIDRSQAELVSGKMPRKMREREPAAAALREACAQARMSGLESERALENSALKVPDSVQRSE